MNSRIKPGHVARSFAFGFVILFFSTNLVACGPGPKEPAAAGGQSFAQGEPSFELVPAEGENESIIPAQNVPQPEGAL